MEFPRIAFKDHNSLSYIELHFPFEATYFNFLSLLKGN